MKHVIVCQSSVYGGAEAYLNRLYSMLLAKGVEPVLIGSIPGWTHERFRTVDVAMSHKWSSATMLSGVLKLPRERAKISRAVRDEQSVSLFHVQYKREQIGFTDILAKHGPVVWTEHGRFLRGPQGMLLGAAYRAAAQKTSAIICVSDEVAADVRRVVGPKPRIETIPNAIDTVAARPPTAIERTKARKSLRLDPNTSVALWIGRVHRDKRPEIALELASSAEWDGVVLLAGEGQEMEAIRKAGERIPNLRILGHVEHTQPLYHAADVALFTSTGAGEGYPTTILESSAFGVPTVTVEDSGMGKYVKAAGGTILPEGSEGDDWARGARNLITPQARHAARLWGERHDVDSWIDAHEAVFKSIVKPR